ncbi:hypothetical protein SAMN05444672_12250 [Bacillus sp. OK838]|nr:hypothetical protein SAMN05444672_12250 [Bacillus sp. OK838]
MLPFYVKRGDLYPCVECHRHKGVEIHLEAIKTEDQKEIIDIFNALRRRVKLTRKSRINASKRLRQKHLYFEKITNFYSLLVLILSVWFINISDPEKSLLLTKMLLILSLSLTFFTMFLNTKNYKERAGSFETNYQQLDILLNKLDRIEIYPVEITDEALKGLQREYEKLIIGNENHHDIDYMTAKDEFKEKYKFEIMKYNVIQTIINITLALYPVLLILFIYFVNYILN